MSCNYIEPTNQSIKYSNINLNDCQQKCTELPCNYWIYDINNKTCVLPEMTNPNNIYLDRIDGKNNQSVTNNRFLNNTTPIIKSNVEPFYVSGSPIGENNNVSEFNVENKNPYNGSYDINLNNSNDNLYTYGQIKWEQPINQYINTKTSTNVPNTICNGTPYGIKLAKSAIDCENKCISDQRCDAWTFQKIPFYQTGRCTLKEKEKDNMVKCVQNQYYTSGKIIDNQYPQQLSKISSIINNVEFNGKTDASNYSVDANQCEKKCLTDPNCNKWTYTQTIGGPPGANICRFQYGTPQQILTNDKLSTTGEIYYTRSYIPNQQNTPYVPVQEPTQYLPYNCNNTSLYSSNGDICRGTQQNNGTQLCYRVGQNTSNKYGWYGSIGDMNCSDQNCMSAKQLCNSKPLCSNIGEQCNIPNLKNI